jgi:hypothetical protein
MSESGRSNCLPGHWPSERQIRVEVKSHHEKFKGMPTPVFLLSQESSFFVKSRQFLNDVIAFGVFTPGATWTFPGEGRLM